MATNTEIDDSLYSRQRYVLGDSAMKRMASSNVLIIGVGGLGVEIAKNIILAGVKSVTVQDHRVCEVQDLGTQFFIRQENVTAKANRAEACLGRLVELNPYVTVKALANDAEKLEDLSYLKEYQCVIVTECSLQLQLRINAYCRKQTPQIKFASGDVYGVFCWTFCDFGDKFEVVDNNGEEPTEVFISKITKANPGVVTTLENRMHGFESGDHVTFREVQGMAALNGTSCEMQVVSPYAFTICDTSSDEFGVYEIGGTVTHIKVPQTVKHEPLSVQLKTPSVMTPDLCKFEAPMNIHLGLCALHRFQEAHGRLPGIRCSQDADKLIELAKECNAGLANPVEALDEKLLRTLSYTSQGCLTPLCAFLGGIVAQEGLKALTGKFTPLNQWLHFDTSQLVNIEEAASLRDDRYRSLQICIGDELCRKLTSLTLFMVGCGAIGCEMLKNYALLGVGCAEKGLVTITDNDLIEKSNLNRQFLFRPRHIRQPKSTTAATSAKEINSDMNIEPLQHKVCPQTESTIFHDQFFEAQHLVVNALDNVEARRYMDSRCITNQRALLESGTMGAKGHVQVIVPHLTETYNSQRDPPDEEVPYCTLKSFPAIIDHCIQWARDKFASSFAMKPSLYNKFWSENKSPEEVIKKLEDGMSLEGAVQVSKLVSNRATDWAACVTIGRLKFQKYFNYRAKQLLHAFPLDTKLKDGSSFWSPPKRPPVPVQFDTSNTEHMLFVRSAARLYADVFAVKWTPKDLADDVLIPLLAAADVPEFKPAAKTIVTDENAKKPETIDDSGDELEQSASRIRRVIEKTPGDGAMKNMAPISFEKDDDSNGHIDFITASSNLRASMYNIESADRLKTKRIAGRIVPAIATTTATVAGLVSLELIKLVHECSLEKYRNCFLNLALPVVLCSEPGPVQKTAMSSGTCYSIWDRWALQGTKDTTLQQFINLLKEKYNVQATMVVQGSKMIFVPMMPGHKKRLPFTMVKLLKPAGDKKYIDLIVSYAASDGDDEMGPPVRYFLSA